MTPRPGIPPHPHVPACDAATCRQCSSCGRVHHGGGDLCLRCFGVARLGWPAPEGES